MPVKFEKQSLLVCFLTVLLAYWPVTSFQFAIKNDFFRSYFPLKQFMSMALKNGIFPLWNPYLNYGFPMYGDMSLAWWNPGTWIIAIFPGYSVWTFTLEQVIYLMLATLGMHKLSGRWTSDLHIRSMAAVSYACCGYFTGQLQHFNWIAAAGTLPFVLLFLIRFIELGDMRNLAATAFCVAWFATVAHPGLIIGLGLFSIPAVVSTNGRKEKKWRRALTALAVTLLCCAGMIYGYAEVLPYTNRSSDVSTLILREGATTFPSWTSFAIPLAVMKGEWHLNDISLRNCYIGILPLMTLFLLFGKDASGPGRSWGLTGMIFLFISSDLFLPAFRALPPLNFIRLSGELRIFALLAFIIVFTIVIENYRVGSADKLFTILSRYSLLMVMVALTSLLLLQFPKADVRAFTERAGIRDLLAGMQPAVLFLFGTVLQALICTALMTACKKRSLALMKYVVYADMILAVSLTLPFTGVGTRSVADLDQIFDKSPNGIPVPATLPEKQIVAGYPDVDLYAGNWALMSRQIAQDGIIDYPLILRSTMRCMESSSRERFLEQSPFFLSSGTKAPGCTPESYSATAMGFEIETDSNDTLILKQNMFKGWQAIRNGQQVSVLEGPEGFMSIPLSQGNNLLYIRFRNPPVRTLLVLQFVLMGFLLLIYALRSRSANA